MHDHPTHCDIRPVFLPGGRSLGGHRPLPHRRWRRHLRVHRDRTVVQRALPSFQLRRSRTRGSAAGATDDASCLLDDARFADASAEVGFLLNEDGFTATFGGQGHADGAETFNRHDVTTYLELGFTVDTRLRVDWTMEAGGLGSAWFQMRRLGDIGGELDVSPAVIDRSISSYIEPLSEQGQDVVFIPAGRWNLRLISNHQASGDWEEGFQQSWSACTHSASIVALGDVDGDGAVGVVDLLAVIAHWGVVEADDADARLADLDGNDTIDVNDLLRVISDWG